MSPAGGGADDLTLRYAAPAAAWTDALPLGNGRLGAMCFGGPLRDRVQVNDDTCWSGSPATNAGLPRIEPGEGPAVVAATREALARGDVRAAERHVQRLQHGHSQAYQPLVDLWVEQLPGTGERACPGEPVVGNGPLGTDGRSRAVLPLGSDGRGGAGAPLGAEERAGADEPPEPDGPDDAAPAAGTSYARWLDLRDAVAGHAWTSGGVPSEQEVFVSAPAGVLVLRRVVEGARADLVLSVTSAHPLEDVRTSTSDPDDDGVRGAGWAAAARMPSHVWPPHEDVPEPVERGTAPGSAVTAVVGLRVLSDGDVVAGDEQVAVRGAREVVVLLATETDFGGPGVLPHGDVERLRAAVEERLDAAVAAGHERLRAEHVAEHRALLDRVELVLGPAGDPRPLTTDERLVRHADGAADPGLAALAFQYGRYLLVAGSRPGTQPMGLQGLWNEHVQPPWSGNYTLNINTEMNYWPALGANLAECHEPLLTWLGALAASGTRTARELYGARGWAAHHNSDVWGFSLPAGEGDGDPCWTAWPLAGAWLSRHLWDHYEYTGDAAFLGRAWPVLRGAALFVLDWLVELPDGSLGTAPATSPENKYVAADGLPAAVSASTTSDLAMVRDLLERTLDARAVLGGGAVGSAADVPWPGDAAAGSPGSADAATRSPGSADAATRSPGSADAAARNRGSADAAAANLGPADTDDELGARIREVLRRLPAERVGADGRLAEWLTDVPDAEPTHRHQSHLYRVHPGTSIDPDQAPALAAAAVASLDARGPESTGWSLAWRLNLRARLRDVAGVEASVRAFLAPVDLDLPGRSGPRFGEGGGVYRNLFCAHPPFQVDGNLGFTAGVVETLVQGHRTVTSDEGAVREVHLLPALPGAWAEGSVRGLRVRGGVTVAITWSAGRVTHAELAADRATTVIVREGAGEGPRVVLRLAAGVPSRLGAGLVAL
ncbi:glycosyl hydrolase family 95 catalytic domain-containing protein [Cellulomonas cellasea]|uniref:Alpha-L-fucosidase 2 n=1 Tax=Cellulomonas cellasea TaxID=43670 RepID=A0A7W4UDT0_9CELL|nr:glycoside hydrolase N-terminal domain-containing protein [Cellulomonas cellasea]MBB2922348.1 alpha-L-fucosidase 2 [Cellulomonas cellasea]